MMMSRRAGGCYPSAQRHNQQPAHQPAHQPAPASKRRLLTPSQSKSITAIRELKDQTYHTDRIEKKQLPPTSNSGDCDDLAGPPTSSTSGMTTTPTTPTVIDRPKKTATKARNRTALSLVGWFTIAVLIAALALVGPGTGGGTVGVALAQQEDPRQQDDDKRGRRPPAKEEDRRMGSGGGVNDDTTKYRSSSGDPTRSPAQGPPSGGGREDRARQQQQQQQQQQQKDQQRKRRRRDAREVRRILRAAARGDWYGVLGLRNWEVRIPGRKIGFQGREWLRLPEFRLFRPSTQDVRKAYRRRSVGVHPDRNRDAQAPEAFRALEEAAALLSDESQRASYDAQVLSNRIRRRDAALGATVRAVASAAGLVSRTASVARHTLGPFAVPALVLGSLIV